MGKRKKDIQIANTVHSQSESDKHLFDKVNGETKMSQDDIIHEIDAAKYRK